MSAQEKVLINQRRRESYHIKKLLRTRETVDHEKLKNRLPVRKEGKREYKRRLKKTLANNLHPDSIAMANPQWVPKFISPTPIEPIKSASELEIPDFSRAPIYIPLLVEQTSNVHQIESGVGRSVPRRRVFAVERNALRNQRNTEFHATIGQNRMSMDNEDMCDGQLPTVPHDGKYCS